MDEDNRTAISADITHPVQTQLSLPTSMASKLFPLLVFRSPGMTSTMSRLMSFCDGGGEPSTQPFQPLRAATRFLRSLGTNGGGGEPVPTLWPRCETSSPSSGVRSRFDEVADVLEEIDGPGVVGGDEGMGGGVTERERCMVAMLMVGRACQKDEVDVVVLVARGTGAGRLAGAGAATGTLALELATALGCLSAGLTAGFTRFLSFSRSRLSFFLARRSSSSSTFSTTLYTGTPLSRLVSTSRPGRESKSPARTLVAVRRRFCALTANMVAWALRSRLGEEKMGKKRGTLERGTGTLIGLLCYATRLGRRRRRP